MSEIHLGVGSYVTDALDAQEEHEFAEHLAVCPACRREIREFGETASELGHLVAAAPPPELRAGVLGAIREVRPLPPLARPAGDAAPPQIPAVREAPAAEPAPIDELAVRRERRTRRWLTAVAAAAVVVALAMGGWVYGLNEQRQNQVAQAQAEAELLSAPDAKIVVSPLRDGGQASFVVSKARNRALFIGTDLPDPGDDRTYQLWRVYTPTNIEPAGLVPAGGRQQRYLEGDIEDVAALAVSLEPAGGSPTPTIDQILADPLPI